MVKKANGQIHLRFLIFLRDLLLLLLLIFGECSSFVGAAFGRSCLSASSMLVASHHGLGLLNNGTGEKSDGGAVARILISS